MTLTRDDKYLLDTALYELSRNMPALSDSALAMADRIDAEPAIDSDPERDPGHQYATETEHRRHVQATTVSAFDHHQALIEEACEN